MASKDKARWPKECRICMGDDTEQALLSPCDCSGSIKYIHFDCMALSIESVNSDRCEICTARYRHVFILLVRRSWLDYVRLNPMVICEMCALLLFYALLEIVLLYQVKINHQLKQGNEPHGLAQSSAQVPVAMHLALQVLLGGFYAAYSYCSYKHWRSDNLMIRVYRGD